MPAHENPRIDSRLAATIGPDGRTITVQRGFIRTQDGKYTLWFLFNPTTIQVQYGLDQNIDFNISNAQDFRDSGMYNTMPNQRLSFRLLFDRMYEVKEGTIPKGVEIDMEVLRGVLGMYDSLPSTAAGSDNVYGIMLFRPVDIVFASQSPLKYFGVIEQVSINYTLTNWAQVPTRCELEVSARLMPKTMFGEGSASPGTVEPNEPTSRPGNGQSSTNQPFPSSPDAAERWQSASGNRLRTRIDEVAGQLGG